MSESARSATELVHDDCLAAPTGRGRAVPGTVGFTLGAIAGFAEALLVASAYRDSGIHDLGRFLAFYAAALVFGVGTVTAIGARLALFTFDRMRPALAVALGAGGSGLLLLGGRWAMALRTGSLEPLDPKALLGVGLVLGGALGLAMAAYIVARSPLGHRRGGGIATLASGMLATLFFLTRATDYEPPEPIPRDGGAPVESILSYEDTNVLLISIDTLRADHLPTYGYARQTAPILDTLARKGIVFENAVTQRTYTAPALATLLTGTYPPTHRVLNNRYNLGDFNLTLAEMLATRGYHTASAISNPALTEEFNFDQGFVENQGPRSPSELRAEPTLGSQRLNDEVLPMFDRLDGRRFFFWIHYADPHTPYVVPSAFRPLFLGDELSDAHGDHPSPSAIAFGRVAGEDEFYRDRQLDFVISQYDAAIRLNDSSLGAVFDKMTELELWENTLVIVTSDHGESLGEHDRYFQHGATTEDNSHVPLIFHNPRLPSGVRIASLVSLVDVLPTVLDLLGLPPSPLIQGRSFAGLILGGERASERPHHFIIGDNRDGYQTHAVRTDTHKLILDVDERWLFVDALVEATARHWLPEHGFNPYRLRKIDRELYDLESEPVETTNLAGRGLEVEAELSDALWSWFESAHYEGRGHETARGEIPPHLEEALRALGYVE